jgi:hypothetical protein
VVPLIVIGSGARHNPRLRWSLLTDFMERAPVYIYGEQHLGASHTCIERPPNDVCSTLLSAVSSRHGCWHHSLLATWPQRLRTHIYATGSLVHAGELCY